MKIMKTSLNWAGSLTPLNNDNITHLIQHHMAHPRWDLLDVHRFHRDHRGWLGIGYSYFIDFDGNIYRGRGLHVGAHAGSNWNARSLGIGYQGYLHQDSSGHSQQMPDKQLEAGAWLNAKLIRDMPNLTIDSIVRHGDVSTNPRNCPGSNFRMKELLTLTGVLLEEEVIYRVQISECNNFEEAQIKAGMANEKGFNTFIGYRNDLYVVQIGAYRSQDNADHLVIKAQMEGFDAFISTKDITAPPKPEPKPEPKPLPPEPKPPEEPKPEPEPWVKFFIALFEWIKNYFKGG